MNIKVGINGFGRMGRLGFRAGFDHPEYNITQLNEANGTVETAAHLLEFDSIHGKWQKQISFSHSHLIIDGTSIPVTLENTIDAVDWSGCDIVIDCTGVYKTSAALEPYFAQGVKKVIVACPVKEENAFNVVMGCNDHLYNPQSHHLLTAASCTTNCIAPVIKVIHEQLGIEKGTITTLHDPTNTQVIVDAPHNDLRRARSAFNSLIPTTTGSASQTSINEVNSLLKKAADEYLSGILGYEEKPLVSVDYTNDTRSGIIDAQSTMVTDNTLIKLLVWYDNEVGYATRMMELCQKVASHL